MGIDYSYDMWVPEERLYDFLKAVYARTGRTGREVFHWPDGRKLDFFYSDDVNAVPENIVVGSYFPDSVCLCLLVEPDEVLSNSDYQYPRHENGQYKIGCIYMGMEFSPERVTWLDEEGYCVLIDFMAATSMMSQQFRDSPSIRRLFNDIAREGGAISSLLYCEGNDDRTVFLDGQEMDEHGLDDHHFRDLRKLIYPHRKISDTQKRLNTCLSEGTLSQHDTLARIEWAQSDSDSGIRAAACQALSKIKTFEIEELLCKIARHDQDWRVRSVALHSLEDYPSESSENVLFEALYDEHYNVRIAAMNTLHTCDYYAKDKLNNPSRFGHKQRDGLHRDLFVELEKLFSNLSFTGASMGAFLVAMTLLSIDGKPHHADIIRQRMNEPGFPFVHEARKALERLAS